MAHTIPHKGVPFLNKETGRVDERWYGFLARMETDVSAFFSGESIDDEGSSAARAAEAKELALFAQHMQPPVYPPSDTALMMDPGPRSILELSEVLAQEPIQRRWSTFDPIRDTRANRTNYAPSSYPLALYAETDAVSDLVYQSDGASWLYFSGIYRDVLANLLSGLTANDDGLLYEVTDYDHVLQRIGNAWTWGPGEIGNGYVQSFARAPNTVGSLSWQVCDGSTVAVLNPDGTTTNVAVPNYATAAYLKLISAGATIGPTAASGTTANTTATNNAAATGITVDAHAVVDTLGAGVGDAVFASPGDAAHTVNDPTHNHTQNAHNHAPGTLELRNTELLAYYRR